MGSRAIPMTHAEFVDRINHIHDVHGVSWARMGRHIGSTSTNKGAKGIILSTKYLTTHTKWNPTLWEPRVRSLEEAFCDCNDPKE